MCKSKTVRGVAQLLLLWVGGVFLAWNAVQAQEPLQPVPLPPPGPAPQPLKVQAAQPPNVIGSPVPFPQPSNGPMTLPPTTRKIAIDPMAPFADLLPQAPKNVKKPANRFLDDLKNAPEVTFQEALSSKLTSDKSSFAIAHQLAKIRHANQDKTDAFLQGLIVRRVDLQGVPFAMGEDCRITGPRAKFLAFFSSTTHGAISEAAEGDVSPVVNADKFWAALAKNSQTADEEMAKADRAQDRNDFEAARVAALTQILAPESAAVRLGLVRYLSKVPHKEATMALARLVLFSAETDVRGAAVEALRLRREKDFVPTLLQGFRYPYPEVAKRASEALVRLECTDAVPKLVDLLDEADPRLPVTAEVSGKKTTFVNEMVRINHHRNCILCHAPADSATVNPAGSFNGPFSGVTTSKVMVAKEVQQEVVEPPPLPPQFVPPADKGPVKEAIERVKGLFPSSNKPAVRTVTVFESVSVMTQSSPSLAAKVPLPNEPLQSLRDGGYGSSSNPDIMVRIDVTYLRQDFSLMMPVHDAAPWPDKQRFDFLVRKRVLSPAEAEEYQQQAAKTTGGQTTAYQRAILFALRELTQRDTAPTPQAWREMLSLPVKSGG